MVFNCAEAARDFPGLLRAALTNDVFINGQDGARFKLVPVKSPDPMMSPFEGVRGVTTSITMRDIVDVIREGREER